MVDNEVTKEKGGQKAQGKVTIDKRHSHFRISATKDETGDLRNIDMICSIDANEGTMCGDLTDGTATTQHVNGTNLLKESSNSKFSISAKKDATGDLSSVEMNCSIDSGNSVAEENTLSGNEPPKKDWITVLHDVLIEAWKQPCVQLSNLGVAMFLTVAIFALQYYDVVSVSFDGLEGNAITICASIAGLTFTALALILPLAKFLQVGCVDYHKELAGIFSYTILINLKTVVWALILSWMTINDSIACKVVDYLLVFLLIYSIMLACSATLHCFCVHTFMSKNK